MNQALIDLAIQEAPVIIAALKAAYIAAHPADVAPTDAQVIAAYRTGFLATVAKDEAFKAAKIAEEEAAALMVEIPDAASGTAAT